VADHLSFGDGGEARGGSWHVRDIRAGERGGMPARPIRRCAGDGWLSRMTDRKERDE